MTKEMESYDPIMGALKALIKAMKKAKAAEYAQRMGVKKPQKTDESEAADSNVMEKKEDERPSAGGRSSGRLSEIVSSAVAKGKD